MTLQEFAERYTAAWCSGNAANVAACYAEDGSLSVNGTPAAGRKAVQDVAQGFMSAFPNLRLTMDNLLTIGDHVQYHWTCTGTNTGPGGTGNRVRFSGYELWRIGKDGLIQESQGHFDAADYERQLAAGN
jgi:uncharacterized protein (TIGR02246 family)